MSTVVKDGPQLTGAQEALDIIIDYLFHNNKLIKI